MTRRVLFSLCLLTTLSADAGTRPAGPINHGLRIFFTGHSYHFHVPGMMEELVKDTQWKDEVTVGTSLLGSSKVAFHWGFDVHKAVEAGAMDVQTMTPLYLPDIGIEQFATLGLAHNPNYRATVQELWLPFDMYEPFHFNAPSVSTPKTVDHNAATGASLRALHKRYFKEMDELVAGVNKKLGKQVVFVVPVGQAVIILRERVIAGKVPEVQRQEDLFADVLGHPAPPLQALVTYCHFAVIYRHTPVGLAVPSALAQSKFAGPGLPALNKMLQELAWETVIHHPLSGVTGG